MSRPIGMFSFLDANGETMAFEATRIVSIAPAHSFGESPTRSVIHTKNGPYASSTESVADLLLRYNAMVAK